VRKKSKYDDENRIEICLKSLESCAESIHSMNEVSEHFFRHQHLENDILIDFNQKYQMKSFLDKQKNDLLLFYLKIHFLHLDMI
jgi:hypothetical protein